ASRLDFAKLSALTFEPPDAARFPALRLAREALDMGGIAPISLNAANEIAVDAYLSSKIRFLDIARIVEDVMVRMAGSLRPNDAPSRFEDIQAVDEQARATAREICVSV